MASMPEEYTASGTRKGVFASWKKLGEDCKGVVAIDFGTTRTGLLVALKKEGSDSPDIFTPDWDDDIHGRFGVYNVKTDSSILLDKDGNFRAFGKKARLDAQNARSLTLKRVGDYWLFFEHFKMELHTADADLDTATIAALNGERKPAKLIFTEALKYLKKKAMGTLSPKRALGGGSGAEDGEHELARVHKAYGLPMDEANIRWVITVPAIWSEKAKNFMRKCALEAGMGVSNEQLVLLYEPEAASIAAQFHLRNEANLLDVYRPLEGDKQALIKKGDVYLILDCGGGTVDIVAHEWLAPFQVREVIAPTGGRWGSIYVEKEFQQLFDDIFGADQMAAFRTENPSAWLRQMDRCVKAKEAFHKRRQRDVVEHIEGTVTKIAAKSEGAKAEESPTVDAVPVAAAAETGEVTDSDSDSDEGELMHNIQLVEDLVAFLTLKKLRKCVKMYRRKKSAADGGQKQVAVSGRDVVYLVICEKLMESMFDKVIAKIVAHLLKLFCTFRRQLFEEKRLRYVFIVGGFAESHYLERRITDALLDFEGVTVIVPDSPGLAVVRGAANVEHIRKAVKARVLRRSYGRMINLRLEHVKRWPSKPQIPEERVFRSELNRAQYVSCCFEVLAKKGECVDCGHSISVASYPSSKFVSSVPVDVYFSDQSVHHLLPLDDCELLKRRVGGKALEIPYPKWFVVGRGKILETYTFAEERELQLKVTFSCGKKTTTVDVEAVRFECVGD